MGDEQFLHTFLPCHVSAANVWEILITERNLPPVTLLCRTEEKSGD